MKIFKYLFEFHGNPGSYFFLYGIKGALSFFKLDSEWKGNKRIEAVDMNFPEPSGL